MKIIRSENFAPSPPYFVNRSTELRILEHFWASRYPAMSIVGLGGMGKSALVSKFLENIASSALPQPDTIFALSCYDHEGLKSVFTPLFQTFGGLPPTDISTEELIASLTHSLSQAGRSLVILDGVDNLDFSLFDILYQVQSKLKFEQGPKTIVTSRVIDYPGSQILHLDGLDPEGSERLLTLLNSSRTPNEYREIVSALHGHPLSLTLAAPLLDESQQLMESIRTGPARSLSTILPTVLGRIDEHLSDQERALLARIALFRIGVTIGDLESLFARSEDSAVSGPLYGLSGDEIIALVVKLHSMSLIQLYDDDELAAQGKGRILRTHPIIREYFIQAIPDSEPLHRKAREHYISLLESSNQPISKGAAEIVLEVVYHLMESKHINAEDIKRLAARLPRDETPNMRAYSSLLDAAVQLEPQAQAPKEAEEKRASRAFLSYVREDIRQVTRLRTALEQHGIDVWQDTDRLIPGRRWKTEIRDAIKSGDFFIACFSQNYAARARTYMREELLIAVEELRLRPTDRAWFIPVLLSPIEIPQVTISPGETLCDLHWVNFYDDWDDGISSLLRALKS